MKTETKTQLQRRKVAPEQKLDKLLAHFVLNVRKPDTNVYVTEF